MIAIFVYKSIIGMEQKDENKNGKTIIASFVIDESLHRQMKIFAASSGKKIKDVLNEALTEYFEKRK